MNTDTIADFLTRIRNAIQANHRIVEIPASILKKKSQKFFMKKVLFLTISLKKRVLRAQLRLL